MFRCAGVHHRRPRHHENFPFAIARALEFARHLPNYRTLRLLDRNVGHEFKSICACSRSLDRRNANALMAGDDLHSLPHFVKFYSRGAPRFAIHRDSAIHDRGMHFDFFAIESDEGLLVGRDIKIGRKNSVRWRGCELHVHLFSDFCAVLPESQDEFIERFVGWTGNLDPSITLVGAPLADFDLPDFEISAGAKNLIEDLWQNQRIDNMSAQLNRFQKHPQNLAEESERASQPNQGLESKSQETRKLNFNRGSSFADYGGQVTRVNAD